MKRIVLTLMSIALCAASATAQEALNKTVEVSRSYDPTLLDAYKITTIPRISDTARIHTSFTYPLRQVNPIADAYMLNPIAPAKVQREKFYGSDGVGAYIRLGFGLKTATLFDAFIGGEPSPSLQWSTYLNHYGSFGKVLNAANEKIPSVNMRNEIGASLQYNFNRLTLYATLGFKQQQVRFYGYDTLFARSDYNKFADNKNNTHQYFNKAYASLVFSSKNIPDSTLSFGGSFHFHDYRSRMSQSEDALRFALYVDKQVLPELSVGMDLKTDAFLRNSDLAAINNAVISLAPRIAYRRTHWEASAAVNLTIDNVGGKFSTYCYPSLGIAAFLADNLFIPYVELRGSHEMNSYASLTTENPYLNPNVPLSFRNTRAWAVGGGFKGKLGSMLNYRATAEYAVLHDLNIYLNQRDSASLGAYFDVRYANAGRTRLEGEIQVHPMRALEIRYLLRYDMYNMGKDSLLVKAYNRPAAAMALGLSYNLWNKILFSASFDVHGGYTALDFAGNEVKRAAASDLNLGIEYKLFKRSTIFLQLSNILNSHYQMLNNYPTYGFSALLGYSCVF